MKTRSTLPRQPVIRMSAKRLEKIFPDFWHKVEVAVYDDLRIQKKVHGFGLPENAAGVIAYNAAFLATSHVFRKLAIG